MSSSDSDSDGSVAGSYSQSTSSSRSSNRSVASHNSNSPPIKRSKQMAIPNRPIQLQNTTNPNYAEIATKSTKLNEYHKRKTVLERYASVLKEKKFVDVLFLAGSEQKQIPLNKFPLICGSPVFEKMLDSTNGFVQEYMELDGKFLPVIKVPDIEPGVLMALFHYLYAEKVELNKENVMDVLYAARKYEVKLLEDQCLNFIKSNLDVDGAFELLGQIRHIDDIRLQFICWSILEGNASEAVKMPYFLQMDHGFLSEFLSRDNLKINEIVLYQQTIQWAKEECHRQGMDASIENLRGVLGPALYHIRFPIMHHREFTNIVAEQGILMDADIVAIYKFNSTKVVPKELFFPSQHRRFKLNRNNVIVPSIDEIAAKMFNLNYFCKPNFYMRPFYSPTELLAPKPCGSYEKYLSKGENIYQNITEGNCLCVRPTFDHGELSWTIDLSGHLIKSIYVKISNLFHCVMFDAYVSFGSIKVNLSHEKSEVLIREHSMHGNYLEISSKLARSEVYKQVSNLQDDTSPNFVVEVEFY